jgi:hypothetical protein
VILEFLIAVAAIVAAWIAARRWALRYTAHYGRRPPNGWMFARVDNRTLERERLVLLAILVLTVVVALLVLKRTYPG